MLESIILLCRQFTYVLYRYCSLDHSVNCLIYMLINERVWYTHHTFGENIRQGEMMSLFIYKGRICLQHQRKATDWIETKTLLYFTPGAFCVTCKEKHSAFFSGKIHLRDYSKTRPIALKICNQIFDVLVFLMKFLSKPPQFWTAIDWREKEVRKSESFM